MTITYGAPGASTRVVNSPLSSQRRYNAGSTLAGSYCGGRVKVARGIPYISR